MRVLVLRKAIASIFLEVGSAAIDVCQVRLAKSRHLRCRRRYLWKFLGDASRASRHPGALNPSSNIFQPGRDGMILLARDYDCETIYEDMLLPACRLRDSTFTCDTK